MSRDNLVINAAWVTKPWLQSEQASSAMSLFSLKEAANALSFSTNIKKDKEPLDMFRSAPMTLLQLYIPSEAAQITIAELGQLELLQFRDVRLICRLF